MNKTFAITAVAAALLSATALAQTTTPQAGSATTLGVPSGAPIPRTGGPLPITDTPAAGHIYVLGDDIPQGFDQPRSVVPSQGMTQSGLQTGRAAEFVQMAANSGWFEVESSRMALDKTAREPVRGFARHMVDDHSLANQQLATLARTNGIEPPTRPDAMQQQKLAQLQTLSGANFDRAYVTEQVMAHRQAVDLFQTASRSGAPDLQPYQGFIAQTLPTLQQHLRMAEEMAGGPPVAQTLE